MNRFTKERGYAYDPERESRITPRQMHALFLGNAGFYRRGWSFGKNPNQATYCRRSLDLATAARNRLSWRAIP